MCLSSTGVRYAHRMRVLTVTGGFSGPISSGIHSDSPVILIRTVRSDKPSSTFIKTTCGYYSVIIFKAAELASDIHISAGVRMHACWRCRGSMGMGRQLSNGEGCSTDRPIDLNIINVQFGATALFPSLVRKFSFKKTSN